MLPLWLLGLQLGYIDGCESRRTGGRRNDVRASTRRRTTIRTQTRTSLLYDERSRSRVAMTEQRRTGGAPARHDNEAAGDPFVKAERGNDNDDYRENGAPRNSVDRRSHYAQIWRCGRRW